MAKYVTQEGLNLFWSGIKSKLRSKVDVVSGKGLSTNDLTDALKANYDAAYTNRVTGVTVNGSVDATKASFDTTNGRVLNIVLPTKLQDLTNDSTGSYATESYVDGITGTPTSGKTLVQMIGDVAAGNLSIEFVSTLPEVASATNNTIYMVPTTAYKAVTNPTGNPSTSNYYELSNGSYVASTDTTVQDGKRYYVVNTESNNIYAEYIVGTREGTKVLEKIGDTQIDLSGYVLSSDIGAVSNADIQALLAEDTSAGATDPVNP